MKKAVSILVWLGVASLGAFAYLTLALRRGEPVNSAFILTAALCTYAVGYRFYSKWIAARVLALDDRRTAPSRVHDDGKDFVPTNKWIVFGHHFAAISGPGPLLGPVLASQFGYLPGALWIMIGVALGGAVQDFVILFCSLRRDGKSLGQMVKEEISTAAGALALVAIFCILVILLAVLALVVVNALAESPWGIFTVSATIPIAMFMGGYMRWWRVGRVMEATAIGVACLLLAVWGGQFVHGHEFWSKVFTINKAPLAWSIIAYGFAASVLPVWLLHAPRDYLSTFMKLGTIFALAIGVFCVLPDLKMPAINTKFLDGSGLVVPGKIFPFCFITIACGAISGFHTLIASGTTPKLLDRESYARPVGYGAMLLESLVAIMALIAACTLEPGVYLSINVVGEAAATAAKISALGFPVTVDQMNALATQMGEHTLFGRTGGAVTLAVGMAQIFSRAVSGRWLDLWYHFAIMFEALFILTTLDAGTRVGRYLVQEILGHAWKPLGDVKSTRASVLASLLIVAAWGFFLIQGVTDPDGGVKALWPLFGIANQMLASLALCLGTTVILKMQLAPRTDAQSKIKNRKSKISFALVTFVPLLWLLTVTMTAGYQKIFHDDPRIGFLAQVRMLDGKLPALEKTAAAAQPAGDAAFAATKALRANRVGRANALVDAAVAGTFLVLVALIVLFSVREWILLLARKRRAELRETEPVWLPDYELAASKPVNFLSLFALAFALARELSGEAAVEREQRQIAKTCNCEVGDATREQAYVAFTTRRFKGVNRCC